MVVNQWVPAAHRGDAIGDSARTVRGLLLRFVDQVLAAPRRPEHRVAWDFWQQFDTIERLEAQRIFRPSLYKALPTAARASGITW